MRTTPVHPRFGVEVHDVNLAEVTATDGYPALRDLFERHSLLLFRDQSLDGEAHLALGRLFGPVEVRSKEAVKPDAEVSVMTNRKADGSLGGARDPATMWLAANQFWHTDSTFLPIPALANILAAKTVTTEGGETEFVSTRAAFADLPEDMKRKARGAVLRHSYAHSRRKLDESVARDPRVTMWEATAWRAVFPNPVTGEEALYIASHVFGVAGMDEAEGTALVEALTDFATRPECVYSHRWQPGDVIIWDERATMHRGRPWPYDQERKLTSICVSLQECDGLASIRPEEGLAA